MIRSPRSLAITTLALVACGGTPEEATPSPTPGAPFVIELDGQDYGADRITATLTSTGASWIIAIGGRRPDDPNIADDEFTLIAKIVLDDLDQRAAGDQIFIDTDVEFHSERDAVRLPIYAVTTTPNAGHDPGVRRAHVAQGCYCTIDIWPSQTVTGTITLTAVSTTEVEGDIELETSGGIPFVGPYLNPGTHTSRFSGAFVAD